MRLRLLLYILIFVVFACLVLVLNTRYSAVTTHNPTFIKWHRRKDSEVDEDQKLIQATGYRLGSDKKVRKFVDRVADSKLRIVYNRVPKCGSRSVLSLFAKLSLRNKFTMINSKKNYPYALKEQTQKNISKTISLAQPPFIYQRHFHYTDFLRYGGPPVVYINLIRDPVNRSVSHFYFRRYGDGISGHGRARNLAPNNETYDECVLKGREECNGNWGRFFVVPFFCGHIEKCRSPSRWAIDRAKENVVKKYLVVGILEEFDDFVKVLEIILPRFFKGAYDTLKKPVTNVRRKAVVSKTRNKKLPSQRVKDIAKRRMTLEYEFYDFIKTRFHALKKELEV